MSGAFLALILVLSMVFLNLNAQAASAQMHLPEATADLAENTQNDANNLALEQARATLTDIQNALKEPLTTAALLPLRNQTLEAGLQADNVVKILKPKLQELNNHLAELGNASADTSAAEVPDITLQRTKIQRERDALDAQIKFAYLLKLEADQVTQRITLLRRALFRAHLGEKTVSVLSQPFWAELREHLPQEITQLAPLATKLAGLAKAAPSYVSLFIFASSLALLCGYILARRKLLSIATTQVPGRLRRSSYAIGSVILNTATPTLLAQLVVSGLRWEQTLNPALANFLTQCVAIVGIASFVAALGYAMLSPKRLSWRLMPEHVSIRLRHFSGIFAAIIFLGGVIEQLTEVVNASLSTAIAFNCIVALLLGTTLARALRKCRYQAPHPKGRPEGNATPETADYSLWFNVICTGFWCILFASVIALLLGYVALGSFMVKQVTWSGIVFGGAYLLFILVQDCTAIMLQGSQSQSTKVGTASLSSLMTRPQMAVLLSGLGRLIIGVLTLVLLAGPFGESPSELIHRALKLRDGITLGAIQIQPATVLQALFVFALCLLVVKTLKKWLAKTLLPTTRMDAGMQASATTLFGYAGGILAVAAAMSTAGISLERVAWVASALSVGIGFGLQAVVQNFVSGLILLAERPVKVGDWVALGGGIEGDIRRINVRATEIQMSDRSTVIVPNSELITKTVRNITHNNPLGLVQIKLPMPIGCDVLAVRAHIFSVLTAHTSVLLSPAPNVTLDGIDKGSVIFSLSASVGSPRLVSATRSALLFDLLQRLKEEGIAMSTPATVLVRTATEDEQEQAN